MTTETTIAVPESVLLRLHDRIETEVTRRAALRDLGDHDAIAETNEYLVELADILVLLLLGNERIYVPGDPNPPFGPADGLDYPPDMAEDLRISRAEINALRDEA